MQLRWSHCVMYVRDIEKMVAFYSEVLGFEVSDRGPMDPANPEGIQLVFMTQVGSDHHQIAFANVRGDGPTTTLDHIAFRVENLSEVKEMAERLRADGRATGIGAVNHGNAWSCYFQDPEENKLEVFCDSPFHVNQPQIDGWDFAMSEDELKKATEEHYGPQAGFQPMDDFTAAQRRKHDG